MGRGRVEHLRPHGLDQASEHLQVLLELLIDGDGRVPANAWKREAVMHDPFDDLGVSELVNAAVGGEPEASGGDRLEPGVALGRQHRARPVRVTRRGVRQRGLQEMLDAAGYGFQDALRGARWAPGWVVYAQQALEPRHRSGVRAAERALERPLRFAGLLEHASPDLAQAGVVGRELDGVLDRLGRGRYVAQRDGELGGPGELARSLGLLGHPLQHDTGLLPDPEPHEVDRGVHRSRVRLALLCCQQLLVGLDRILLSAPRPSTTPRGCSAAVVSSGEWWSAARSGRPSARTRRDRGGERPHTW